MMYYTFGMFMPHVNLQTDERMRKMTIYGFTEDFPPANPPNNWTKLAEYKGTDYYNPVAVMILPTAKTVRHLAVMTGNDEGIVNLKEVQVFKCLRKSCKQFK